MGLRLLRLFLSAAVLNQFKMVYVFIGFNELHRVHWLLVANNYLYCIKAYRTWCFKRVFQSFVCLGLMWISFNVNISHRILDRPFILLSSYFSVGVLNMAQVGLCVNCLILSFTRTSYIERICMFCVSAFKSWSFVQFGMYLGLNQLLFEKKSYFLI